MEMTSVKHEYRQDQTGSLRQIKLALAKGFLGLFLRPLFVCGTTRGKRTCSTKPEGLILNNFSLQSYQSIIIVL